jgi:hypothetical protein
MDVFLYFYLPFIITGLILFVGVVVLRVMERFYPRIKYISASSIISFVLILMLILSICYAPSASKGHLGYLLSVKIGIYIDYLPFFITLMIVSLFNIKGLGSVEDPLWQCFDVVVSFVFYTLLIFLVIKIALYLKKKFRSGSTSEISP